MLPFSQLQQLCTFNDPKIKSSALFSAYNENEFSLLTCKHELWTSIYAPLFSMYSLEQRVLITAMIIKCNVSALIT
jgi:hypothetical protein